MMHGKNPGSLPDIPGDYLKKGLGEFIGIFILRCSWGLPGIADEAVPEQDSHVPDEIADIHVCKGAMNRPARDRHGAVPFACGDDGC